MDYFTLLGVIFLIHLLAVSSPGPDFIIVLKNALQHDRKTAIFTSLGISFGISIHIFYSLVGISFFIQKNQIVFNVLKILGALYIIFLGVKTFFSTQQHIKIEQQNKNNSIAAITAVKIGFLTNVLNPKATLFFLSLFTLVIPPGLPFWFLSVISFMLITVTFLWFVLVSLVFTNPLILKKYESYENVILKTFGLILIILGVAIFFEL